MGKLNVRWYHLGVSSHCIHSDKNFMKSLRSPLTLISSNFTQPFIYRFYVCYYGSCVGHFQRAICGKSNIHTRDREVLREFDWLLFPAVARESLAGLAYLAGDGEPINLLGDAMFAAA